MKRDIFSTPIFIHDFTDADSLAKIDALAEQSLVTEQHSDHDLGDRSNKGSSYHTEIDFLGPYSETVLHKLISPYVAQAIKEYGYVIKGARVDYWSIISRSGGYNKRHCHPNSLLSGAFYVSAPSGSGRLEFCDPRYGKMMETTIGRLRNNTYHDHVTIIPERGRLVLFPSFLEHEVQLSTCSEPRIIYSFNVTPA